MSKYIDNPNIIEVWDYSKKNMNEYKKHIQIPCYYVPITYHPSFENIYNFTPNTPKDIDLAFFGCVRAGRRQIMIDLLKKKFNVWSGSVAGNNRLSKILNRSKIVIIIHFYEDDLCIDYYRLFSLISNKIFTIHEMPSDDQMDNSMNKLIFAKYDKFVETCEYYLSMTQEQRDKISEDTYQWWKINNKLTDKIPKTIFNINKLI